MTEIEYAPGLLTAATVTTWIYQLAQTGLSPEDPALREAIGRVSEADSEEAGDAAGLALMERVQAALGEGEPDAGQILAFAKGQYGDHAHHDLGQGAREDRAAAIRKFQFSHNSPWLAQIWERKASGVAPTWLLIGRAADAIYALDPNPWNDVDETRSLPWGDFQVLWELSGCTSLAVY